MTIFFEICFYLLRHEVHNLDNTPWGDGRPTSNTQPSVGQLRR